MDKKFISAFDGRRRTSITFKDKSLTNQSDKKSCDINVIMDRYQKTGLVDHVARFNGNYEDCAGAVDYHTALNIIQAADEAFMTLPSALRARFENDPAMFIEFVNNPANFDEVVSLGLAKAKDTSAEASAQPIANDASADAAPQG